MHWAYFRSSDYNTWLSRYCYTPFPLFYMSPWPKLMYVYVLIPITIIVIILQIFISTSRYTPEASTWPLPTAKVLAVVWTVGLKSDGDLFYITFPPLLHGYIQKYNWVLGAWRLWQQLRMVQCHWLCCWWHGVALASLAEQMLPFLWPPMVVA